MNGEWLLQGGRVIDPARQLDATQEIGIADGKIVDTKALTNPTKMDCGGKYILPGLIDLYAHCGETGDAQDGTVKSEAQAATAGGITTLVHSPDTFPPLGSSAQAALLQSKARDTGQLRLLPVGAWTSNLDGKHITEMHSLLTAGCIAVGNASRPIADLQVLRNALKYAATYGIPMILHPLEARLATDGCAHDGEVATRLGLPGLPAAAESIAVGAIIELVRECGANVHLSRVSCRASVDAVARAQQEGMPITADCAIANLFLSEADLSGYDAHMHLEPPLRSTRDQDALRRALQQGVISAICSNHIPKGDDDKAGAFCETDAGGIGIQTMLPLAWRLGEELGVDALQRCAWLTVNAAGCLSLPQPSLAAGEPADLLIFDPNITWELNADSNRSAANNSPFWGWSFDGKPTHVFFAGQPVLHS